MSYSTRTFILGPDDTLYRLASAKFSRMVDDRVLPAKLHDFRALRR